MIVKTFFTSTGYEDKAMRRQQRRGSVMYEVVIARDAETGYFYVHDSEIIGLNACAPTFDAVIEAIEDAAPELIAHNHKPRESAIRRLVASLRPQPDAAQLSINYTRDIRLAVG